MLIVQLLTEFTFVGITLLIDSENLEEVRSFCRKTFPPTENIYDECDFCVDQLLFVIETPAISYDLTQRIILSVICDEDMDCFNECMDIVRNASSTDETSEDHTPTIQV